MDWAHDSEVGGGVDVAVLGSVYCAGVVLIHLLVGDSFYTSFDIWLLFIAH